MWFILFAVFYIYSCFVVRTLLYGIALNKLEAEDIDTFHLNYIAVIYPIYFGFVWIQACVEVLFSDKEE